jgi:threonine aldolase
MRVELRSDTFTIPTERMRKAMYDAEVGDDVFAEDPTVNLLEEQSAALCGKEAALFVPSGTMANQICVRVQAPRGSEIILQEEAHLWVHEVGGLAALAQVQTCLTKGKGGIIQPDELPSLFRINDIHCPPTKLVCIEQTSMMAGGTIYPLEIIQAIARIAQERGAKVHMDGARLFNAVVASGIPAAVYASPVDSLMFCLSKGLGCPVGSMVVGSVDFIREARVVRKLYGGGMRQVGVLAACGLVALEEMIQRLAEDHQKAQILAEVIQSCSKVEPDWPWPQTNIVVFGLKEGNAALMEQKLAEHGVFCLAMEDNQRIRLVTHKDVSFDQIQYANDVLKELLN